MPKTYKCSVSIGLAICVWCGVGVTTAQVSIRQSYNEGGYAAIEKGNYAEAERLFRAAIQDAEQSKVQDGILSSSYTGLGRTLRHQRKYAEAEPLLKRAVNMSEKILGADSTDVAVKLDDLGSLYFSQAKYSEAEPLYKRSLAIKEQNLGADNPEIGVTQLMLGQSYRMQAKYAEAEPLYKRHLAICEKIHPTDHPYTAMIRQSLALLLDFMDRHAEVDVVNEQALAVVRRQPRSGDLNEVARIGARAEELRQAKRYEEARVAYISAMRACEQAVGPDHLELAKWYDKISDVLGPLDRPKEASAFARRAAAIRERQNANKP